MIEMQGRLAEIIFQNEENFYTVAVIEQEETWSQFVAVGTMPHARAGMTVRLKGDWKTHPEYGDQFAVSDFQEELPQSEAGIRDFLSSGIIKGVGPKMAAAIVSRFGKDSLEIIEKHPDRLREISGLGKKKIKVIADSFHTHREFAEISLFFANYGVQSAYAMKMYKIYGADTVRAVMENPYRLIDDLRSVGFGEADRLAAQLGVEPESEFRLRSGIRYMLRVCVMNGNTYYPLEPFLEQTARMLDVSRELVREHAEMMVVDDRIRLATVNGQQVIYPELYFQAESQVAQRLYALSQAEIRPVSGDLDGMILRSEAESGIHLSDEQKKAVRTAVQNGVCVITGGPGTGKTTIIQTILDLLERADISFAIAAPTGRAAKRITETSGREASTIHRLLEYTYSEDDELMSFGRNASNCLEQEAIIIDEMSMVDILLMDALTEAISVGTRLILVGDADQLPAIRAGNVLRDIIHSEAFETVILRSVFRQAGESMIVQNAHRINRGEYPVCNVQEKDFFLMVRQSEPAVLSTIRELCFQRLPAYYAECDRIRDIQVLTPVKKGLLGTQSLNAELQQTLNPPDPEKKERTFAGRIFRVGDKVIQIRNNYQLAWKRTDNFTDGEGVFNGDIGFIQDIDSDQQKISVLFDDVKYVRYEFNQIDELDLAYAMTIHKSQGSEFPVIVMPMAQFPPKLATRNLLYTGVTRGKTAVVLVGSERVLHHMVDNTHSDQRYSGLSERLQRFRLLDGIAASVDSEFHVS